MTGHAIILGCGIAGLSAAAALAPHSASVTLVERDVLPTHPVPRKGVPQGHHLHGLLSTGAQAMDTLLPGTLRALLDAGAHRVSLSGEALLYGPHGWMHPAPTPHFVIGATRPLTEHVLRTRLLDRHRIRLLERTEATLLLGDARRVRGVRVRDRATQRSRDLPADLVVDTTGRTTRTPAAWLPGLGLPPVPCTTVDAGLAYSSFIVEAATAESLVPCVNLQPDPRDGTPGRGGFVLAVEGGRWMVALSGTRGAHPPLNNTGIKEFALSLRDPLIGELLSRAVQHGPARGFGNTANRRHHYPGSPAWPAGFLVLGDAATTFNPLYGQGMTVAALSALALRRALERRGGRELGWFAVQKRICRTGAIPWWVCTTEDIRYPGATGPPPSRTVRAVQQVADRLRATASSDPDAARLFYDLVSLTPLPQHLLSPHGLAAVAAVLRGPTLPSLTRPHLSSATTTPGNN